MSDVAKAVRTQLGNTSDVTNTAPATQHHFLTLPQGATLPAVVIQNNGRDLTRHLGDAQTLADYRLIISCYSEDPDELETLGDAVASALEMQTGSWNSIDIRRAHIDDIVDVEEAPNDGSSTWRFVRLIMVGVWAN